MSAFIWSFNAVWNVVYLPMGHTAKFAMELSTSSEMIPKEHLENYEPFGPRNPEIH